MPAKGTKLKWDRNIKLMKKKSKQNSRAAARQQQPTTASKQQQRWNYKITVHVQNFYGRRRRL